MVRAGIAEERNKNRRSVAAPTIDKWRTAGQAERVSWLLGGFLYPTR